MNLAEYVEGIRSRHPRLSLRQMALDAGIGATTLYAIVDGRGASPSILKSIADRWGNDEDYIKMLQLAGHPLPEGCLQAKQGRHLGALEWEEVQTALGYMCTYGGIQTADETLYPEDIPGYNLRATMMQIHQQAQRRYAKQRQHFEQDDEQ